MFEIQYFLLLYVSNSGPLFLELSCGLVNFMVDLFQFFFLFLSALNTSFLHSQLNINTGFSNLNIVYVVTTRYYFPLSLDLYFCCLEYISVSDSGGSYYTHPKTFECFRFHFSEQDDFYKTSSHDP